MGRNPAVEAMREAERYEFAKRVLVREDLHIEPWPPRPSGMSTGMPGPGVRVTHSPTGLATEVTSSRHQHRNHMRAMYLLAEKVEAHNG